MVALYPIACPSTRDISLEVLNLMSNVTAADSARGHSTMARYRPSSTSSTIRTATSASVANTTISDASARRSPTASFYTPQEYTTYSSRTVTRRRSTGRPSTGRPRTGVSTLGFEDQEIICAISESRGISPVVGLAFVNLDTAEAVLSQISDRQTYIHATHKLIVYRPSIILVVTSAANPKSKLFSIVEDSLDDIGCNITLLDRRYWNESTGLDYIEKLAFADHVESIKTAVSGNYYAVCCFAAVLKYAAQALSKTFPPNSLRIKYEPVEGAMMIDLSTMQSLELVQNLQMPKSKDSLFGLLNQTLTPMGARLLRSNVLQPLTSADTLNTRYEALEELSTKEQMFFGVRQALKPFLDIDKMLTQLILIPSEPSLKDTSQAINNVIMLKHYLISIPPVLEALDGARAPMLQSIRQLCAPQNYQRVRNIINETINEDTAYANQPLDLRNQRTYAVKAGVNRLLDVARQTYKEVMTDALDLMTSLAEEHDMPLQTKFDNTRQFYMRLPASELRHRNLPPVFINVFRRKDMIECQTLNLVKLNQRIADCHNEVLIMSDQAIQDLIATVRESISNLFNIGEGIAMLDMLSAFAQLVTTQDYVRPQITDTLAIQAGRHPIREKIHNTKFIPNDVYATQQKRFQIVTGCNMSGKSTYIRSVALMTIMAQIGSFVPAQYAAFPNIRQLFARVSTDDNIEANVSTFAAEMRETAFILRNVDRHSMIIVDELGRGTSTRDGLAIALAIAEALVESRALVWFVTHFRDLARIMAERNGVVNLHLEVDLSDRDKMEMMYRVAAGAVEEEHYGIKLARLLPFPPDLLEHAELVSKTIEERNARSKKNSLGLVQARKRKLQLNMREQLLQAKNGNMQTEPLRQWLVELRREFVVRMTALEDEAGALERGQVASMVSGDSFGTESVEAESVRTVSGETPDAYGTRTGTAVSVVTLCADNYSRPGTSRTSASRQSSGMLDL